MKDMNDFYKTVGRLVREARDEATITQDTLATRVGLTRTSVTNIEKGRQKILLHTLVDLAAALNVVPSKLLPELNTPPMDLKLGDLLKGRPRKEQQWIKSAFVSHGKDK